jgi:hypothetical protein
MAHRPTTIFGSTHGIGWDGALDASLRLLPNDV